MIQAKAAIADGKGNFSIQEIQIAHAYEEYKGGHTAEYWQEHIVRSLLFFWIISLMLRLRKVVQT